MNLGSPEKDGASSEKGEGSPQKTDSSPKETRDSPKKERGSPEETDVVSVPPAVLFRWTKLSARALSPPPPSPHPPAAPSPRPALLPNAATRRWSPARSRPPGADLPAAISCKLSP